MTEGEARILLTEKLRKRGMLGATEQLPEGVWRTLRDGGEVNRLLSQGSRDQELQDQELQGQLHETLEGVLVMATAALEMHRAVIDQSARRFSVTDMPQPEDSGNTSQNAGPPAASRAKTKGSRVERMMRRGGWYKGWEEQRQRVAQDFYRRQMESHPMVSEFRAQLDSLRSTPGQSPIPGTGFLRREDVWTFLTSPLTQYFGFQELIGRNLDPVTSAARIVAREYGVSEERHNKEPTIQYEVEAATRSQAKWFKKSAVFRLFDRRTLLQESGSDTVFLMEPRSNQDRIADWFFTMDGPDGNHQEEAKPIEGFDVREESGTVVTATVVAEALRVVDWMSTGSNGRRFVSLRDALVLLLTGTLPDRPIISFAFAFAPNREADSSDQTVTAARIFIDAASWVSADTLADLYRHWQTESSGRDNRPVSEKSLEMFEFVNRVRAEYTRSGRKCTWQELYRLWRQKQDEQSEGVGGGKPKSSEDGYRNFRFRYLEIADRLFPNPMA